MKTIEDRIFVYCLILMLGLSALGIGHISAVGKRERAFEDVQISILKDIIEARGYYLGLFGRCPSKKDSRYYMPCRDLLSPRQLEDVISWEKK